MFEPFASPAPLSRRHFSRARDMSTARLVIVTACYGSRGDVAPLARLARAIQTATKATNDDDDVRPTSVVFMANPHFAELAAGLDFHPTGDAQSTRRAWRTRRVAGTTGTGPSWTGG